MAKKTSTALSEERINKLSELDSIPSITYNGKSSVTNWNGSGNESLIGLWDPYNTFTLYLDPESKTELLTFNVDYVLKCINIDFTAWLSTSIAYASPVPGDSDTLSNKSYVFKINNIKYIYDTKKDKLYKAYFDKSANTYRPYLSSGNESKNNGSNISAGGILDPKKEFNIDYIYSKKNSITGSVKLYATVRCSYSENSNNKRGIPVTGWYEKDNNIWLRIRLDYDKSAIFDRPPIIGWIKYFEYNLPTYTYYTKTDSGSYRKLSSNELTFLFFIKNKIFIKGNYENYIEYKYSNKDFKFNGNLLLGETIGTKISSNNFDKDGSPTGANADPEAIKDAFNSDPDNKYSGIGDTTSVLPDPNPDYDNDEEYYKYLQQKDLEYDLEYWTRSNETDGQYSLKSHNSIIGLPLQFMGNVDLRPGASTYGKDYLENILYDMNIAIIKPGGPVLNPKWDDSYASYSDSVFNKTIRSAAKFAAYWDQLKQKGVGNFLQDCLFQLFKGSSARFYSFMQDYTHYTHYVNTLCHLFVTYLGISDKTYINARGDVKTYGEYTDDIKEIETDEGYGLKQQMGFDNAVYMYYSDEGSSLNQNFTNQTMASGLSSTLNEASNAVKEWGFLINAAGIESGNNGIVDLRDASNFASRYKNTVLGRLLSGATEGVTTILAGNNISLPEIYSDSDTTVQHTFKVKLVSPYGDPESVFLYVLRPLARMLAFSLPRQFSANSYGSPFIVQAFSKGQFNCQLGIVTELSITRCGNGGESHTIHHIPTELEVSITIADMYEKVFLSNEYYGNGPGKSLLAAAIDTITGDDTGTKFLQFLSTNTAARLIFNNVGLIDFCASFCGYNLNTPPYTSGWKTIVHMMHNRTAEYITHSENDGWLFPQWEKMFNDSFNQAVQNLTTPLTTLS